MTYGGGVLHLFAGATHQNQDVEIGLSPFNLSASSWGGEGAADAGIPKPPATRMDHKSTQEAASGVVDALTRPT